MQISNYPTDTKQQQEEIKNNINSNLEQFISNTSTIPCTNQTKLFSAIKYSLLSPSAKRTRGIFAIALGESLNIPPKHAMIIAMSVEMMHTYTLIHDDLPCMDNDDLRRGEPSCHKKFDEATALLAGSILMNLSLQVISNSDLSPQVKVNIISLLTHYIGTSGVIGGQMLEIDLENNSEPLSASLLFQIMKAKTSSLFLFIAESICTIPETNNPQITRAALIYSQNLGMILQLTDDLTDMDNKKTNAITVIGKETIQKHILLMSQQNISYSLFLGKKSQLLQNLTKIMTVQHK